VSAFIHHVVYEFRSGLRDRSHLLLTYLFPLVFFALIGGIMTKLNPFFLKVMIPAMSVFALMSSFLLSEPSGLVSQREGGVLRSYRINGVPGWAALAAPLAANIGHLALVTVIISLAGRYVFGAALPADLGRFVLVWIAAAAAHAALGALIAVIASSSRSVVLVSQLLFIPSIMLGGLMMPAQILPPALARLSLLFPASHAMRAFGGGNGWETATAILGLGALLASVSALLLYDWEPKSGRPAARKFLALAALLPYAVPALLG
jgi:ABC-2 type transport system permease protein